jgi:hypothetical protein
MSSTTSKRKGSVTFVCTTTALPLTKFDRDHKQQKLINDANQLWIFYHRPSLAITTRRVILVLVEIGTEALSCFDAFSLREPVAAPFHAREQRISIGYV